MRKLIALALLTLLLAGCGETVTLQSEIHEKYYQPSSTSTGVGIGSNGKTGLVTTSNPASYDLQLDSGMHSLPEELWVQLEVGQVIEYDKGLFGIKNITIIKNAPDAANDKGE